MSHHFDSKLARDNPSLSICDMYLFKGAPGCTAMIMTVNADVGLSASDTFPDEGLYAFRFDLNGDAREEVVFKFRFGAPRHLDGDEHVHRQRFQVRRAEGNQIGGDGGEILLEGEIGKVLTASNVRAFVGLAPELWAADAIAFFNFLKALYEERRFGSDAFLHRTNYFKNRNVMAIALEVPNSLIGRGKIHAWATTSLYGHAPEVQVYRWGFPLFTHLFLSDPKTPDLVEKFHETVPSQDLKLFAPTVSRFACRLAECAESTENPEAHGKRVAARLCPSMTTYATASFRRARSPTTSRMRSVPTPVRTNMAWSTALMRK